MKRQGFIKGSAILLAMVLITKILGLLYKIPLTNPVCPYVRWICSCLNCTKIELRVLILKKVCVNTLFSNIACNGSDNKNSGTSL